MSGSQVLRLAGWGLLVSALVGLVVALAGLLDLPRPTPLIVLQLLSTALLLLGLPAIQATQPETGRVGQVGLGLMGLAAAIAFVVVLRALAGAADFPVAVPVASALAGAVGAVLVGALTVRAGRFPAWAGWALAASGALNFGLGLLPGGGIFAAVAGLGALLGALAIAGYGWTVAQGRRVAGVPARDPLPGA